MQSTTPDSVLLHLVVCFLSLSNLLAPVVLVPHSHRGTFLCGVYYDNRVSLWHNYTKRAAIHLITWAASDFGRNTRSTTFFLLKSPKKKQKVGNSELPKVHQRFERENLAQKLHQIANALMIRGFWRTYQWRLAWVRLMLPRYVVSQPPPFDLLSKSAGHRGVLSFHPHIHSQTIG